MDLEECWGSQPDSQLHPCSHVQVAGLFIILSSEKGSKAGPCRWVLHSLGCSSSCPLGHGATSTCPLSTAAPEHCAACASEGVLQKLRSFMGSYGDN